MFRRLRLLVATVLFAALGALAGRIIADIRRQQAAGETPHLDIDSITLRPRDIAPGVVAAMRVNGPPWSWLHAPPWLAAFAVSFATAAFAREFGPRRRGGHGEVAPIEPAEPAPAWSAAAPESATDDTANGTPAAGEDGPATEPAAGSGFTAFTQ